VNKELEKENTAPSVKGRCFEPRSD